MVILSLITSIIVTIQDPVVQKVVVRIAGGYISHKTGADIKIGKLYLSPNFSIHINDMTVKDLKGEDIASIGDMKVKMYLKQLLQGEIKFGTIELKDSKANLVKYEGEDVFNFQFLVDYFVKINEEHEPKLIEIDRIKLKNFDFQLWDQNKDKPELAYDKALDYAHMTVEDIDLDIRHLAIAGDSIACRVNSLSAVDPIGLKINSLESDVNISSKHLLVDNLLIDMNDSKAHVDLEMYYNDYADFNKTFLDSVNFDSRIYSADLKLSDIGPFAPVMYEMTDKVSFEGLFTGPISDFRIDDLTLDLGKETHFKGNLSMDGLPDFMNCYNTIQVDYLRYSCADLASFHIPGATDVIPLPEKLMAMGSGAMTGRYEGTPENFIANLEITSDIGDAKASFAMKKTSPEKSDFRGIVNAQHIDLETITGTKDIIGSIDLAANVNGTMAKGKDTELDVDGKVLNTVILGNPINEVALNGSLRNNRFNGEVTINDEKLMLDFNGLLDFNNKKNPYMNFDAKIAKADLHHLKIMKDESKSIISTNITADFHGSNIDNVVGSINLDDTKYSDSRGNYYMNSFIASIEDDELMQRRININCDFLDLEMAGLMDFATLPDALKKYVMNYTSVPQWESGLSDKAKYSKRKEVREQDFFVNLKLKDPSMLTSLLMPKLSISKNTTLNGTFTSKANLLNFTLRSKQVRFNGVTFNDIECKNHSTPFSSINQLLVDNVILRDSTDTDSTIFSLQNLGILSELKNDSIMANIVWNDMLKNPQNTSDIRLSFVPLQDGGRLNISKADVLINGMAWSVNPDNVMTIEDGHASLNDFVFSNNSQSIAVGGYLPMHETDTLRVNFNTFDISSFDPIFNSKGFDLDGFVSGDVRINSVKNNPALFTDLTVKELKLNGDRFGDANIQGVWDNGDKTADVFAEIIDNGKSIFDIGGVYSTEKTGDNLNFLLSADSLRLNAIAPFTQKLLSRITGYVTGSLHVAGDVKNPIVKGNMKINDGGCEVDATKVYYAFSPTLKFGDGAIAFDGFTLTDTLGHSAPVEGKIEYRSLKDLNLDLRLSPKNLLVLAAPEKSSKTFYGTAFTDGIVELKGPLDNIKVNISATTREKTNITIPLGSASTVKNTDYITFVNNNNLPLFDVEDDADTPKAEVEIKKKSQLGLNVNLNVTDNAEVNIVLPNNMGHLESKGNGNLKFGLNPSGEMTLRGDYIIRDGKFSFNYENLVKKDLALENGGKISWTGSPTGGKINATGVYQTKAPLSSLGITDVNGSNSINVECLLHLSDALLNPSLSFGIRLPNASDDIKQTVFSIIDTTNQAVMNQQVFYLLVMNSFNYSGTTASNMLNLDVLTNQLSSWLSQISRDFDVGLHYRPGDQLTNEELQIALKTQLFNDYLTLESNFGMINPTSNTSGNASNIVGDVDAYLKLSKDGHLTAHAFNHSNLNTSYYNYTFDKLSPYTQGIGVTYSQSFDKFSDIFKKKRQTATSPFIKRPVTTP